MEQFCTTNMKEADIHQVNAQLLIFMNINDTLQTVLLL